MKTNAFISGKSYGLLWENAHLWIGFRLLLGYKCTETVGPFRRCAAQTLHFAA